LNAALQEPL